MNSQLKKGILDICILKLLDEKDKYGYDLVKIIQELFPTTDESTLYSILRRLHRDGYTDMYYSENSNGPRRKYYKISRKGEEYLKEGIRSWHEIESIMIQLKISQLY